MTCLPRPWTIFAALLMILLGCVMLESSLVNRLWGSYLQDIIVNTTSRRVLLVLEIVDNGKRHSVEIKAERFSELKIMARDLTLWDTPEIAEAQFEVSRSMQHLRMEFIDGTTTIDISAEGIVASALTS